MSTRTIKEYKRTAFEKLAQAFEKTGEYEYQTFPSEFTCNAVSVLLGNEVEAAYKRTFGFGRDIGRESRNETYLWNRAPRGQQNLRVLMLCFAAAMVATGDL
jgi:hypothetical protein